MTMKHKAVDATSRRIRVSTFWTLLIAFVVLPLTSTTIFWAFPCTQYGGTFFLDADLSRVCRMSDHALMHVYASFMILVYPIGIPAMFGAVLYLHRDAIKSRNPREPCPASLSHISFLFHAYSCECAPGFSLSSAGAPSPSLSSAGGLISRPAQATCGKCASVCVGSCSAPSWCSWASQLPQSALGAFSWLAASPSRSRSCGRARAQARRRSRGPALGTLSCYSLSHGSVSRSRSAMLLE